MVALAAALLYLLVNLHYMQQYLDWDQVGYVSNITRGMRAGQYPVFNPHHLHMEIGGQVFHEFMNENFGNAGFTDLVFNNRLRSLLAACIGLFFISLFFTDVTGKIGWGVLGPLLTGLCHGYMVYAGKVDTGIFPALGMILYLFVLRKVEKGKRLEGLLILAGAFTLFLGIMFHQFLALGCFAFFFAVIAPPFLFNLRWFRKPFGIKKQKSPKTLLDSSPVKRYRIGILIALVGAAFTFCAYFYTGKTVYNLPVAEDENVRARGPFGRVLLQRWLFLYENADVWGKGIEKFKPQAPFRGFTDAFVSRGDNVTKYNFVYNFRYAFNQWDKLPFSAHNFIGFFTIFVLAGTVFFFMPLLRRYRRTFLFNTLILMALCVFGVYWEPNYMEFWIVPSLLFVVQGVFICNFIMEKFPRVKGKELVFYLLFTGFTAVIGLHNFKEHLYPFAMERKREVGMSIVKYNKKYESVFVQSVYRNPRNPYKGIYK